MKPARQMANRQMYQTSIITTEVSSQQQNYVLNEEYLKGFYFANRNGKYKKVYGKKKKKGHDQMSYQKAIFQKNTITLNIFNNFGKYFFESEYHDFKK